MRATCASGTERKRANPDKHFAESGFCTEDYARDLKADGIPIYEKAIHATPAVGALAGFARAFRERPRPAVPARASLPIGPVNELAALNVVAATGVPTVPARHAREAADLGFPAVVKVLSADILHKSDLGVSASASSNAPLPRPPSKRSSPPRAPPGRTRLSTAASSHPW